MADPSAMDRAMACVSIAGIDPAEDDASNEVRLHLPGKPDDYVVVGDTGPYYLDEAVVLARSAEGIIAAVVEAAVAAERARHAALAAAARAYRDATQAMTQASAYTRLAIAETAGVDDATHAATRRARKMLGEAEHTLNALLADAGTKL